MYSCSLQISWRMRKANHYRSSNQFHITLLYCDFTGEERQMAGWQRSKKVSKFTKLSTVESGDNVRIMFLIKELNNLDIMSADGGNSYTFTHHKHYLIATHPKLARNLYSCPTGIFGKFLILSLSQILVPKWNLHFLKSWLNSIFFWGMVHCSDFLYLYFMLKI